MRTNPKFNPAELTERQARNILLLLVLSVGLMMTGYGIIMPIMAKRLGEIGEGVDTLGFMTMAFAGGQFLFAPFMGGLADRFGRKPLILLALIGVVVANIVFLLASSSGWYIGIRFAQGAVTAGLLPASMAVVADIFPEERRARWIGILMSSYGVGFIFGPSLGGFLYEWFGYVAPFAVDAGLGLIALVFAFFMLPETNTGRATNRETAERSTITQSLPRPLYLFGTLLTLDFLMVFLFAFVEPQLSFSIYNELKFSTVQFGILISAYGLALAFGQVFLARLSDRFGRKPLIIVGFLLNAVFYLGLTFVTDFYLLLVLAMFAGVGEALALPALSAFYLDITDARHRSRILGIKEASAALGGMLGPLLVAFVAGWLNSHLIFAISGVLAIVASGLALAVLTNRRRQPPHAAEEVPVEPEIVRSVA